MWGVPFTILLVFALNWQHQAWARWVIVAAVARDCASPRSRCCDASGRRSAGSCSAPAIVLAATFVRIDVGGVAQPIKLAFPWTFPLGAALTLGLGLALGRTPNEPVSPARARVDRVCDHASPLREATRMSADRYRAATRDFGRFLTEQRNPRTMQLDAVPLRDALRIVNDEDAQVAGVVRRRDRPYREAVELIVERRRRDGHIYFVGAGTSGRLGVIEAAEQTPTLDVPDPIYQAIVAGGPECVFRSSEGAEDVAEDGAEQVRARDVRERTSSSASRRAERRRSCMARSPRRGGEERDACCSCATSPACRLTRPT